MLITLMYRCYAALQFDQMDGQPERLKIVMTGNSGSGVTSLSLRFDQDRFQSQYISTIGVDFRIKIIPELGGQINHLGTCRRERFRALTRNYYRQAQGVVIAYSITDRYSFQSVDRWYREIEDASQGFDKGVVVCLVGTHLDQEERREVLYGEGAELALNLGCQFMEVSSRDGTNVREMFHDLAVEILEMNRGKNVTRSEREPVRLWTKEATHRTCC